MTCSINHGDCREVLQICADAGMMFDACVTDPPYHLTSIVKRFGSKTAAPAKFGTDGAFARASKGFMGQEWDGGDVAFQPETWNAVLNVMKPGAYLLAFGGTRTYHRLACAIEDGGFEIRDTVMYLYGSGFPKSQNVSKEIDKKLGEKRKVVGRQKIRDYSILNVKHGSQKRNVVEFDIVDEKPISKQAKEFFGWGSALKPAFEPIIVARKPLEGTLANNVLKYGVGGINIDACRVPLPKDDALHEGVKHSGTAMNTGIADTNWGFKTVDRKPGLGRWPANLIHDGSEEVTSDFGSAARFFYCAKANKADRAGSTHPTVKPLALIRYLCRLITPPNGLILDPFAGSGTTGQAAHEEGFNSYLIEQSEEYIKHIKARMDTLK